MYVPDYYCFFFSCMYQIIIVFFFPCVYQVIIVLKVYPNIVQVYGALLFFIFSFFFVLKVYPNIVQVYGAVPVIVSVTQLMTVFFFFSSEIGV